MTLLLLEEVTKDNICGRMLSRTWNILFSIEFNFCCNVSMFDPVTFEHRESFR